jgi:5-formyltetrahydrofolate cyclo-ligase
MRGRIRRKVKNVIRRDMITRRTTQKGDVKAPKDSAIKKKLMGLPEFKKSEIILFYVSIRGEVKTESLISEALEQGKRVLVPFVDLGKDEMMISEIRDLDELEPGAFGIPEPKHPKEFPLKKIDLVVTPGIAFDRNGNRVGFGTGFYDKFLVKLRDNVPFIALAYDFQILKEIPAGKRDIKIHKIVTEKEVIKC